MLNEVIWSNSGADDDSTSSSSSSDDGDDVPPAQKQQGRRRPRRHRRKAEKGSCSRFNVGNDDFKTKRKVSKRDGRLTITVNEANNRGYLAKALGATFLKHLGPAD